LDINLGARYDRFWYHMEANDVLHSVASDNTYNTFNPSIGAQYRLLDRLKAHASFGTAFAVPDAYQTAGSYDVSVYFADWDYTWTQSYQGNPDLKPEKSRTIDAGMSFFTQNHAFNSDITYFQTHHNDQIVENRLTNGTITFMNANKSLMNGLEFSAEYDFGSLFNQRFSLKLYSNWTWLFHADYTKSTLSSTGSDSTYCKDLLYVRKLTGNAGLSFQHPKGLSARLSARYNGSRFEDDNFSSLRPDILESDYTTKGGFTPADHVLNYPDFLLFDLNAHYVFPNKLQLGLSVSNLFDENYSDKDGYHMQGRQLKINVGYQF
jgi:outer membrane receptor protein involved in Fe transport